MDVLGIIRSQCKVGGSMTPLCFHDSSESSTVNEMDTKIVRQIVLVSNATSGPRVTYSKRLDGYIALIIPHTT